jgi:hypothetical protein
MKLIFVILFAIFVLANAGGPSCGSDPVCAFNGFYIREFINECEMLAYNEEMEEGKNYKKLQI